MRSADREAGLDAFFLCDHTLFDLRDALHGMPHRVSIDESLHDTFTCVATPSIPA